jgi:hypothetical protein
MMSIRLPILLFCLWGASLGYALAEPAVWSRPSPDTVLVSGELDRSSYDAYQKQADQGYRVLVLNRVSGNEFVALRIARDVVARKVAVRIDHSCIQGCARFLMLAGQSLSVDCDAVLALGLPGFSTPPERKRAELRKFLPWWSDLRAIAFDAKTADYLAWYKARYQEAQNLLAEAKAPIGWLTKGPTEKDLDNDVFNSVTGQFEKDSKAAKAVVFIEPRDLPVGLSSTPSQCPAAGANVRNDRLQELNLRAIASASSKSR